MLMTNVESERPSRAQGIQCGIARISIVARTGSPKIPRSSKWRKRPHRVVVAHVLVDLEHDAGATALVDQHSGLAQIQCKRLLSQNAPDMFACFKHASDHARLLDGRDRDIDNLDRRFREHRLQRGKNARNPPQVGDLAAVLAFAT